MEKRIVIGALVEEPLDKLLALHKEDGDGSHEEASPECQLPMPCAPEESLLDAQLVPRTSLFRADVAEGGASLVAPKPVDYSGSCRSSGGR